MKSNSEEKARLRTLLSDAISLLCKNSLGLIDLQFSIEALIGISVNDEDVMVLSFKETVLPGGEPVSYVWQKESEAAEGSYQASENDANNSAGNVLTAEEYVQSTNFKHTLKMEQGHEDSTNCLDEVTDITDLRVKREVESMPYEEYQNQMISGDFVSDVNSSSSSFAGPSSMGKRRKQSVPVKVYGDQFDHGDGDDNVKTKLKFDHPDKGFPVGLEFNANSYSSNPNTSQPHDGLLNGECRYVSDKPRNSVPFKKSAHKVLNTSRDSKKYALKGENSVFTGFSGRVRGIDFSGEVSPGCSLPVSEQESFSNQPENYTYQALNSSQQGSNSKRRKPISGSSMKNFSEQDSVLISELLPYLSDQHRPMLIPPTVTQFAPKKRCRVCYSKKIRKEVRYCCYGCSDHPGLCLDSCFYQFHLVRGAAYPKPSESLHYSQEVPIEDDCPQVLDDSTAWNDCQTEMT